MKKRAPHYLLAAAALTLGCTSSRSSSYAEAPAASYTAAIMKLKVADTVSALPTASVAANFFSAAKVQPLVGRFFIDADRASSAPQVVVLSHDLWTRSFDASPTIIGRAIELDGRPATVVGIAPHGFAFPRGTQLWTPRGN
jgi:hypothetical protein